MVAEVDEGAAGCVGAAWFETWPMPPPATWDDHAVATDRPATRTRSVRMRRRTAGWSGLST